MKRIWEAINRFFKETLERFPFFKGVFSLKTALGVLAVLLLIAFVAAGIRIIPRLAGSDVKSIVKSSENDLIEIDIDMSDFIIPEEIRSLDEFKWVPYRGVKDKWDQEDVDEFWISPEETVRQAAEEKNRKHIEELFESIP